MRLPAICILVCLQSIAMAQTDQEQVNEPDFMTKDRLIICVILICTATIGCVIYQRRNGYPLINYLKAKINDLIIKIQDSRSRQFQVNFQISNEETLHSAKRGLEMQSFQTEKSETETDISGMELKATPSPNAEIIQAMQLQSDTPQVDMKDIFEKKKQSKVSSKNKPKKPKTKSKIRGRLQSKINEQQQSQKDGGEEAVQENTLTEEKDSGILAENNQSNKQNQA